MANRHRRFQAFRDRVIEGLITALKKAYLNGTVSREEYLRREAVLRSFVFVRD